MNHLNETGIYKNVAGFEKLIAYCQGFGDKYNPGADDLNLLSLVNYHANYATAENRANTEKANYENAINERKNVFDSLKVLSTSIMNLMKTYNADPLKIKDMEAYHRKIQGKRATAIQQDTTEDTSAQTADPGNTGMNEEAGRKKTRSVSQQSYDNLINHFEKMLITISTEAGYTPREPELTIEGLRHKLNELKRTNEAVNNQKIAWQNAVINRNYQMNDDKVGLVSVARRVKAYIRATFGYRSSEVAFISKLQFRKI